jgi:thiamine-phosphate pyrophosphorylase
VPLPHFYPILDTGLLHSRGFAPLDAARAILEGGARILQFRHKGQFTREVFESAEAIAQMCRQAGANFVVNDRADIARLLDAGLHVGQDDLSPSDARHIIGSARTLGFSTHNIDQFRNALAESVDYLAFGPVFSTSSKQNPDPVAGLDAFNRIRAISNRPLVAIGGITRDRAAQVLALGADSLAVIADLYPDPLDEVSLSERVAEWLAITKKCYL